MSQSVNGFNFDRDYELQIKNKGKRTGLTFELYDDLQKYIDEGIFVDELNDGFTNKEKRGLADAFMRIHKEKGYDTNFSKMKANEKFVYTAQDYVELAKAAGYVLKDLSPEEQAALMKRIEKSAEEFAATQAIDLKPVEGVAISPSEDVPALTPDIKIKPVEVPTQKIEIAKVEPAPINIPAPDLTASITPQPVVVPDVVADDPAVTPEAEVVEDEFYISDGSEYAPPEIKGVNPDEIPSDVEEDVAAEEEFHLPKSFLKRYRNEQGEMITPENFKDLPEERQAELIGIYENDGKRIAKLEAKAARGNRNIFSRIFGKHNTVAQVNPDTPDS